MAIEFQCPHCDARIRVPDHTAGLRGTCPQCREKLLVPTLEIPRESDLSTEVAAPVLEPISEPEGNAADPLNFGIVPEPAFSAEAPTNDPIVRLSDETGSIARKLKRKYRSQRSKAALLFPIVGGALLIGFLVWNLGEGEPPLEGTLTAVVVPELELPPKTISKESLDPLPEGWSEVVKELAKHPAHMKSSLMHVILKGVQGAIEVTVLEGTESRFVRVDPAQNAALLAYNQKHATDLDQVRRRELAAGVKKFVIAWEGKIRHGDVINDLTQYRNSVGLNALTGGLGHHLEAAAAKLKYLCVYEDSEGRLYFLIPDATKSFELQGLEKQVDRFPGHYKVRIEEPERGDKKPAKSRNERHGLEGKADAPEEMDVEPAADAPPKKPARVRKKPG